MWSAQSGPRGAFAGWSRTAPAERGALLTRVHALVLERSELIAQALSTEMGAAIAYARSAQVPLAAEHIRVARENLARFPFVSRRGTTAILREPIGVCGLITPWNWPLYQITAKVGPALAAGCTVVLKPSELSPLSALLFAEIMHEAGCRRASSTSSTATGPEVGEALATHPDVDMVSITGSTRAGVLVAQAAAPHRQARCAGARRQVAKCRAAGCRSRPLRAARRRGRHAQSRPVLQRAYAHAGPARATGRGRGPGQGSSKGIRGGRSRAEETTHGTIANRAQYDRIQAMIETGIAEGAKLVIGGPGRPEGLATGLYVRPTIFSDVRRDMAVAQEEIFGPVLAILAYDTVDEAVEIANDTVYGLGAHVQGTDMEQVRHVASEIRAGQVHLNAPNWDPNAPFGGYKRSGNGREYGREGMEEYLETKAVLGFYP